MISKSYQKKKRFLVSTLIAVSSFVSNLVFSPIATAKLFDGPVDQLPLEQRVSLRRGELVFIGEDGEYVVRLLVETSVDHAWQVLTDYENFADFLPGVSSSELIENNGDRKVFEQISNIKTFVFSIESRVKIATTESYPAQIDFKAVDGDLQALNGKWTLEAVSPYPSAPPDKVLITHKVSVEPGKSPSDSIFFNIYENRLQETLEAIKEEVEKRSSDQSTVNSQQATVNRQQSTVNSQQSAVNRQQSTGNSQQSAVNSQQSTVSSPQIKAISNQ